MSAFTQYIDQRIADLTVLKNFFPEMSDLLDVCIKGNTQSKKFEVLGSVLKSRMEFLVGRELSFAESDIYTNMVTTFIAGSVVDFSGPPQEVSELTNLIMDKLEEMLDIKCTDDVRECVGELAKSLLVASGMHSEEE